MKSFQQHTTEILPFLAVEQRPNTPVGIIVHGRIAGKTRQSHPDQNAPPSLPPTTRTKFFAKCNANIYCQNEGSFNDQMALRQKEEVKLYVCVGCGCLSPDHQASAHSCTPSSPFIGMKTCVSLFVRIPVFLLPSII